MKKSKITLKSSKSLKVKEEKSRGIDSPEKRLENIAKRAKELPKEHLIKALLDLSKKEKDREELLEYSNRQKEGEKLLPHQHLGKITSKKSKSLDKIFKALNEKISEDYLSLREELNDTLREKLESNYEFKRIMERKLSGNRRQISELFEIVERTKRGIFEEITGMEVPKTKLEIEDGIGLFNEYEGNYNKSKNLIKIYSKPSLSFLHSREKNNKDILNSLIHELTHQEQARFVENREDFIIQGIKDQADIFYINNKMYLRDVSLKKYRRQPVEEEAFKSGDELSGKLLK